VKQELFSKQKYCITLALNMISLGFLLLGARTAYLVDIWFTNDVPSSLAVVNDHQNVNRFAIERITNNP